MFLKKYISISDIKDYVKRRNARKLTTYGRILLWLNYIAIVGFLGSVTAKYISPLSFWPLAFLGLSFPIFFSINVLFSLYWFLCFRWLGSLSLVAILLSTTTWLSFFQLSFTTSTPRGQDIKVLSYNSMLFDLYNWSNNKETRNNILTMLYDENADIVCLQEFYNSEDEDDFHNADTLIELLTTKNIHYEYTITLRGNNHWGIATLTKYPIVKKGKIEFNTTRNNLCIYTDVLIKKDTVRIYNMHLQSIGFNKADYKFLSDLANDKETDEYENSKNILKRLKRAFVKRATQAEIIANHIKNCPYKVIVCGDFNDTPASYTYNVIQQNLNDAFIESGNGLGITYAGKFPRFRIDYILHDKRYSSYGYKRIQDTDTDHYPIVCYLKDSK